MSATPNIKAKFKGCLHSFYSNKSFQKYSIACFKLRIYTDQLKAKVEDIKYLEMKKIKDTKDKLIRKIDDFANTQVFTSIILFSVNNT